MKFLKKSGTLILSVLFALTLNAQSDKAIDSLKKSLETANDTTSVLLMTELSFEYAYLDPEKAKHYAEEAIRLSRSIDYEKGMAKSLNSMGLYYLDNNDFDEALKYFQESKKLYERLKYKNGIGSSLSNIGNVFLFKGNYEKGLEYYLKASKLFEEIGNKENAAILYGNMGALNKDLGNLAKALKYGFKALEMSQELKDQTGIASAYNNIGLVYLLQEKFEQTIDYLEKALEIWKAQNSTQRIGHVYNNLGLVYKNLENLPKSLEYHIKALNIAEDIEDQYGIAAALNNIGGLYIELNNPKKAIEYSRQSLSIAKEIGSMIMQKNNYGNLYEAYSSQNNHKKAFDYLLLYTSIKDSIMNEEKSKQIAEMEALFQSEKKEKEIELLNKESQLQSLDLEKKQSELNKQRVIIFASIGGLLLLFVLAFLLFNRNRIKQKANEQLMVFNEEISEQKSIIEEKNKEITDSIFYAKRIQDAILPPDELVRESLKEAFILFKPKDIVSGDFYWIDNHKGKVLLAAVDCTGHGVPGAFVSIVGNNNLNRVVNEFGITQPAKILDKLNELVVDSFHQQNKTDVKDGMDIALCTLESTGDESAKLQYSGAHNPLYLIRRNDQQTGTINDHANSNPDYDLQEVKADKQPIGVYEDRTNFTNHTFDLKKGDAFYLFSDGFADQFGGPIGKKFKYRQFRELLLSMQQKTMAEQKEILDNAIESWRGELEQIDDICVIGVRI